MNKILNYIKTNKVLLIILAALVALSTILYFNNYHLRDKNKISQHNLETATEEVQYLKDKNGQLIAERNSYIANINELENYLNISKKEIKDLQKTLDNKILYISDLENEINIKPEVIYETVVEYRDSTFNFTFNFKDEWYELIGNSSFDYKRVKTEINKLYVDVPLRVGLTDDWQIFVTSPNPYVSLSKIDGALLDKNLYLKQQNQKRFGISVYAGFNGGYDLLGGGLYAGPGVGIGISYKIL